MFFVTAETLGGAWEESIREFLNLPVIYQTDSELGFCLEAQNVTICSTQPWQEPKLSPLYAFPELVEEYREKLVGKVDTAKTAHNRMMVWQKRDNNELNQLYEIEQKLRNSPSTRSALLSFWDPEYDLFAVNSISPVLLSFTIRNKKLNMDVISRSLDAWLSGLSEMIAFFDIQQTIANNLGIETGLFYFHAMSFHLYDHDYPIALKKLGSKPDG